MAQTSVWQSLGSGLAGACVVTLMNESARRLALAGDLVSNTLFYSLTGVGEKSHAWRTGGLLGLGAGVGAVTLPPLLGLGRRPTRRTRATKAMSVGWYVAGELAAAATLRLIERNSR
jgi:hypothetical protein